MAVRLQSVSSLLCGAVRVRSMFLRMFTTAPSVHVSTESPILVREFIHQALYDPEFGYFSANPQAVGTLSEPILFNAIKGRRHYMNHIHELYKQKDISWFTPVELFKPWYGYALSRYMLKNRDHRFPLQILEIGGGTGTCARNVLDFIKLESPSVYEKMKYVSIEICKPLARMQLSSVHADNTHRSRFSVECRDACDKIGWGKVDERPCFVIMLEVLDNQPHDLIFKENPGSSWMQTHVMKRPNDGSLIEVYRPVEDALIQRCINILEHGSKPESPWMVKLKTFLSNVIPLKKKIWIPTATLQLLETLYTFRPNMSLIVSDFDSLPDVKVEGDCSPLVARKKDGTTEDLTSYLDAKGDADIFFPTDFHFLKKMDTHCYTTFCKGRIEEKILPSKRYSSIVTTSYFMKQYADLSMTQTKGGFNPLLDDYSNMRFYLSRRTEERARCNSDITEVST